MDNDNTKRKAVASIYLPQFDQHEKNDEIPCTLNLQYLIRDEKMTVQLRPNTRIDSSTQSKLIFTVLGD